MILRNASSRTPSSDDAAQNRRLRLQNVLSGFKLFVTGVAVVEHRLVGCGRSFEVFLSGGFVQIRSMRL